MELIQGSVQEIHAQTVGFRESSELVFQGELLAWAMKRTDPGFYGEDSPRAILCLYRNVSERVRPQRRYVVVFQKVEADGTLIKSSFRTYTSLERAEAKSPDDKMHRRIFNLAHSYVENERALTDGADAR